MSSTQWVTTDQLAALKGRTPHVVSKPDRSYHALVLRTDSGFVVRLADAGFERFGVPLLVEVSDDVNEVIDLVFAMSTGHTPFLEKFDGPVFDIDLDDLARRVGGRP